MLKSIRLVNWKTHKDTTLTFKKGVNVMVGVMGAGKSSAMDAISFALFGTFPALNSKRVSLSDLITSRPVLQSEAEVSLVFDAEGGEYRVTRRISSGKNSAKLEKNGAYLQTQPTKVTEEVEELLKTDYDTFSRAVYAEQNAIDYFLELPKGDRKKQIDHMLGLDSFVVAEENTTALINTMRSSIKYEEDALSRIDTERMKSQGAKLTDEISSKKKEQTELESHEKEATKKLKEAKSDYEKAKTLIENKKTIETESSKLSSRISTLSEELKKMPKQDKTLSELRSASTSLSTKEKELSKALDALKVKEREGRGRAGEIDADARQAVKKAKEKTKLEEDLKGKTVDQSEKEMERADAELKSLIENAAAAKTETAEAQRWRDELAKHISKCPVCETELNTEKKEELLKNREHKILSLKEKAKELEGMINHKTTNLKELTESHNTIAQSRKRLAEYEGVEEMMAKLAKEKERNEKEISTISEELKTKEQEHQVLLKSSAQLSSQVEAAERKSRYEEEIAKDAKMLEKLQAQIKDIKMDDKQLYAIQDDLNKQSASAADLSAKLQAAIKHIETLSGQAREIEAQITKVVSMERTIAARKANVANMNKFKSALLETEALLRSKLIGAINGLMQDLWQGVYPYKDYSSLRLDARTDDYVLELDTARQGERSQEAWVSVDSIASGGERSIACLTLRIALAMVVVPNLKWLILDEPTHNIDQQGISKMIDVLGTTLPNIVDQVFIITHDENMKQISSAKIYQFDRNKEENAPTQVAEV